MQIFQTNIVKLAYLKLVPITRSKTIMAFVKACVLPIEELRGELLLKRQDVNYWMGITPQVCYLEKALNDTFDSIQRRIFISKTAGIDMQLIHTNEADEPVIIGQDNSGQMMLIHNNAGYTGGGINFVVNLNGLILNDYKILRLKAIVNKYKLADKSFEIYT